MFLRGREYWGIICRQCEKFISCWEAPGNATLPELHYDTTCPKCGFASRYLKKDMIFRVHDP